jgi:hypothetical protein
VKVDPLMVLVFIAPTALVLIAMALALWWW